MPQLFTNNARALLASGITDSATSLTVEASKADLFPTANTDTGSVPSANNWFKITLQDSQGNVEIVYVRTRTAGSGVMSNLLRGQEGTTARAFSTGTVVGLRITAADVEGSIAAAANSVQLTGDQTIAGTKTFSNQIVASGGVQGNVTGNAATAATLQTARTINGTSFNGSANITTANWGTARTLTIGNTGKSVNGSANVSWSLAEIGVTAATETAPGIVELATAAEAQALASAAVALTPARLADAFKGANQSLSANGYQKLPGGLIIQWGAFVTSTPAQDITITYPLTFPNAAFAVTLLGGGVSSIGQVHYLASIGSQSSFAVRAANVAHSASARWIALGY